LNTELASGRLGDDVEFQAGQGGVALLPVGGIAIQRDVGVGDPLAELERSGADRVAGEFLCCLGWDDRQGGELGQERCGGLVESDADRVVTVRLDAGDRGEAGGIRRAGLGVADAGDGGDDIRRGQGAAVVEGGAGAELEPVNAAVV